MKRTFVAVSLSMLAMTAFADDRGAPYEQTQFDRGVLAQRISHGGAAGGASGAATGVWTFASGVWANNHHFVAPPQ